MNADWLMRDFEKDQARNAKERTRRREQVVRQALAEQPWDAMEPEAEDISSPEPQSAPRTPERIRRADGAVVDGRLHNVAPSEAEFAAHQRQVAGGCACDDCDRFRDAARARRERKVA